jgi:hypothetical protein
MNIFVKKIKVMIFCKKILKNEDSNKIDVIITWELLIKILDKLFDGKKPPDEIMVIDKFKELNNLISKRLNIIKIESVINE